MLGERTEVTPSELQYKLIEYGVIKKDFMV